MKYFFTADYHLGHTNIIKYCRRPFKNIEHMNSEIIRRHNERVTKDDIVFYVGDFCFKSGTGRGEGLPNKAEHYLKQLNGKFIFIRGNHDKNNSLKTIIESLQIKYGGKYINLVHNPKFVKTNFEINFVGHVHTHWKFKRINRGYIFTDVINVGVDQWNFYPVTLEEIMKQYYRWKKYGEKRCNKCLSCS